MTLDWVPACDGFAIVACGDAGMTLLRGSWLSHGAIRPECRAGLLTPYTFFALIDPGYAD
jgi:hypothetical protein